MRRPAPLRAVMALAAGGLAVALTGCGQTSQLVPLPTTTLAAQPPAGGAGPGNSSAGASTSTSGGSAAGESSTTTVPGTADVAYAGSLQDLNEKVTGPAFQRATGAGYRGMGAGALGLSREIAAGEIQPGVFESIGTTPISDLVPRYTSWYVQVAASPLVVAYNPKSRFAPQLSAIASGRAPLSELFRLMGTTGFRLGRTDPNVDPQGQAFYEMVELAQHALHLPAGTVGRDLGAVANPAQVFSETSLEPTLEAGQLDAASAYLSQAVQLHLPHISLPASIDFGDPARAAAYAGATLHLADGRTVHGKPLVVEITTIGRPTAAADAFVSYVLSPAGRAELRQGGYTLLPETVAGDASAVPAPVRRALAAARTGG